jgi:transcriptional regulator with XRE-family HTH domain
MHARGRWNPAELGGIVQRILDVTGLSQREIARRAGFAETGVGRWRDGKNRPSYETVDKLAALMTSYADLAPLVPDLFRAAGYPGHEAAQAADERPAEVREHWDDPMVRTLWENGAVPAERRLFAIRSYLDSASLTPREGRLLDDAPEAVRRLRGRTDGDGAGEEDAS